MEKLAFVMVLVQFLPLQAFKNGLQVPNMLMWCPVEDDHVINVTPSK